MKKLTSFLVALLLALASVTYLYYTNWRGEQYKAVNFPYVLQNAALVYETPAFGKQWEEFQQTPIAQNLSQLPFFINIQESLSLLHSLLVGEKNSLEDIPIIISVHRLAEEQLGYIFYFNTHDTATQVLLETLQVKAREKGYARSLRKYAGYKVTELGNHNRLSYIKQDQYIIASFSSLLIEDVVRGLASKAPTSFISLQKVSNQQGSLYVNFSQLPQLLRIFIKKDLVSSQGTHLATFAEASQLELKLTNYHLLLSGFTQGQATAQQHLFTHTLADQTAGAMLLAPYLPQNTAWLQHFTFSDADLFWAAWKQYRAPKSEEHTTATPPTNILALTLSPLLKGEVGHCMLASSNSHKTEQLVFLKVSDPQAFMEVLEGLHMLASLSAQHARQALSVFQLKTDYFKSWLSGQLFPAFDANYITQVDDYIILANSQEALQTWHTQYQQGKTWANTPAQNAFLGSTLDQAHFSLFIDLPKAWPQIMRSLNPAWQPVIESHADSLKKFSHVSLQLLHEQEAGCYMSVLCKHQEAATPPKSQQQPFESIQQEASQKSLALSTVFQADAPLIAKPWMVKSHLSKSQYVLLQDALYQLYFLDLSGKLLWKTSLEGPITTDIFEVDFYKNNKTQYLFATNTQLHLVDYYGRKVGSYPHALPQPGKSVCLNVIDYSNDKHYRFLLATAQGDIFLKDTHYNSLSDWNPKALQHEFSATPYHLRSQGKDHIIALQANGVLQVLKRKGRSYPGFPIDLKTPVHNPPFVRQGKTTDATSLIILTDTGKCIRLNLSGQVQETVQLDQTEATSRFVLCPESLTGNKYVIMRQDAAKIVLINEAGGVMFEQAHKGPSLLLQYYDFGGSYQFYVFTDPNTQLTSIYDHVGKLIHDVPLRNSHEVRLIFSEVEKKLSVYAIYESFFEKNMLPIN